MSEAAAAAAAAIFRSDLMLGILNPRKNKLSLVFFKSWILLGGYNSRHRLNRVC
jgi:hypothetical protein